MREPRALPSITRQPRVQLEGVARLPAVSRKGRGGPGRLARAGLAPLAGHAGGRPACSRDRALLQLGKPDDALESLRAADDAFRRDAPPARERPLHRAPAVEPYLDGLRGELLLQGAPEERAEARAILKDVQQRIRAVPGPDAWTEALFRLEGIGRVGRAAGDWELAAYTAGQMREHDDAYGGTHLALGLVAQHEGRTAEAAREMAEAVRLWGHADPDLPELAQAREQGRVLASR